MSQFVAAITVATNDAGDTETHYFTDGPGWTTRPTDTPANTWIQPRLLDPGSYRRELFSGNKLWGAVRPSFGEMVLANSDGVLDGWLDYGVDGRAVTIYWGDPETHNEFPTDWTTVLKCYGHALIADFDQVRLRLRDRLQLLDVPFATNTFLGTGDTEGGSDVAQQAKPRAAGAVSAYTPVLLLDASKLLYFVADAYATASVKLYEGGSEITKGSDYASVIELLASAPAPGQCRFYRAPDEPTYVRLGSTPDYDLRALGSYPTLYPSQDLGLTTGPGDGPALVTFIKDQTTTYLEVAEAAAAPNLQWFGMTRLDVWQCGTMTEPSASPVYEFTAHVARDVRRSQPGSHAPVRRVVVNTARTWPSNSVGSVSAAVRAQFSKEDYFFTRMAQDATVITKHPTAPVLEVNAPDYQYAVLTAAADYLALFGAERDLLSFTAPFTAATLALELHDTVALKLPRFGMDDGVNLRVVGIELRLARREIGFTVWG